MKKLLIINASQNKEISHCAKLIEIFLREWKRKFSGSKVNFRDLSKCNIPNITDEWTEIAFMHSSLRNKNQEAILKISSELIAELKEADIIVLGTPVYNWSVPSLLKAYIDQIFRVNETWKVNSEDIKNPYIGQLQGKTLVLLIVKGTEEYELGRYNEQINYQIEYLKFVFSSIGINEIIEISVNGEVFGNEVFERSRQIANKQIKSVVAKIGK